MGFRYRHCPPHSAKDERQLCHRLTPAFVAAVLAIFNVGHPIARSACARVELSRSQFYTLRHRWLSRLTGLNPRPSPATWMSRFGVIPHSPDLPAFVWPTALAHYFL